MYGVRDPCSDFNYKYKLATGNDEVESCQPNPCQNDGKCVSSGNLNRCQCVGHFTGRLVFRLSVGAGAYAKYAHIESSVEMSTC